MPAIRSRHSPRCSKVRFPRTSSNGTRNYCREAIATSSKNSRSGRRPLHPDLTSGSLLVEHPYLLHQCVDLFRRQLACELRHSVFAVADDVTQVVRGSLHYFFRHKRRPAKVSALGGFSVTLCATLLKD